MLCEVYSSIGVATFVYKVLNGLPDIHRAICTLCIAAGNYRAANTGPIDAIRLLEACEITLSEGQSVFVNTCIVPHTRMHTMSLVIEYTGAILWDEIKLTFQKELNAITVPEAFNVDDTAKLFEFIRDHEIVDYLFLFTSSSKKISDNNASLWIAFDDAYVFNRISEEVK
ncbi:hypothetical protein L2089_19950 [Paenibacillus hunanensis]|uniref:hypothetical protein n=1 Tax=Paenibacillus hunanensis TaxID=539262 RepID=UPI0020270202|nr:hypothetical protein [Paenibacillus hunanensis]MCL9662968.1 hypothetical protein [Paenibacillus hunanensis]